MQMLALSFPSQRLDDVLNNVPRLLVVLLANPQLSQSLHDVLGLPHHPERLLHSLDLLSERAHQQSLAGRLEHGDRESELGAEVLHFAVLVEEEQPEHLVEFAFFVAGEWAHFDLGSVLEFDLHGGTCLLVDNVHFLFWDVGLGLHHEHPAEFLIHDRRVWVGHEVVHQEADVSQAFFIKSLLNFSLFQGLDFGFFYHLFDLLLLNLRFFQLGFSAVHDLSHSLVHDAVDELPQHRVLSNVPCSLADLAVAPSFAQETFPLFI